MSSTTQPDRIAAGIALIVGAVFLMSLQDAVVKYASSDLPLWQIFALRGVLAIPPLAALAFVRNRRCRPTPWMILRAMLLVAMYVSLYASVPVLTLATVAAGFYTGPLFIAMLSAVLVGEPVGRLGWLAVAIGFAGVVVILRPGSDAFTPMALLPVLSGLFYALAAIVTRSRCHGDEPVALALALNVALMAAGAVAGMGLSIWTPAPDEIAAAPFLLGPWVAMGPEQWGFVALLAVLIVGIGLGLAAAYQSAPPAVIATFDYSYLIFAAFWGYAIFSERPDAPTLAGMALIAGAGLLASVGRRRNNRTGRPA